MIERAVALETTQAVLPERLPESLTSADGAAIRVPAGGPAAIGDGFNLDEHLRALELRPRPERARAGEGGAGPRPPGVLGITPRSLRYLIQKHGLTDPAPGDKN